MSTSNNIFEAKYLAIKWADKKSALNIKESKDSLTIKDDDASHFTLEATTFSEVNIGQFGQIGIRIIDERITQPIYIQKPNGDKTNLRPVLDNETKKTWWVEAEVWSKSNKRWQSEIFRTSGNVKLIIGSYNCNIKIGSCSFSSDELSEYLKDFKNDLWYLALHETSYISAPVKEKSFDILDVSSIEYFNRFIGFAENIVKKPKSELREIQELKNIKQVKPIPKTFMEIATKGYRKQLTSRAYKATYNVPENQYVLFAVNRIYNLLNNLGKVSNYISTSLQDKIESQEDRINSFSDTIKINREAVISDYNELKRKSINEKNAIVDNLPKILNMQNTSRYSSNASNFYDIEFEATLGSRNEFYTYFLAYYIKEQTGLYDLSGNDFHILFFNNTFKKVLKTGNRYKFTAKISYVEKLTKKGNTAHELKFLFIENLSILSTLSERKYQQLNNKAIELSKANWTRQITVSEKKEQEQEKIAIKSLIDSASLEFKNIQNLSTKLTPTLNKIRALRKKIIKLKIEPKSLFPNSMSFIQNPNYQGVHKTYKEIQSLSGIDERIFKGLEDAEEIGILNTSLIYERWCFLQIIKVLIDKFGFKPEKDWKNNLLNQIINLEPNKVRNVKLKFENKKTNRNIILWYEKELTINEGENSPRRADFVIDLTSNFNEDIINSKRLVLDAKFYEKINNMGGISKVVDKLYNFKDYSESSKNQVFILHPSLKSVPKIKTPQEWSENSFLGETQLFDWDDEYPNHRYGALLLSPIQNKGKYLDNLQMCIGMFLQYGIENNSLIESKYNKWIQSKIRKDKGLNPIPEEKQFCLLCGSDECTENVFPTPYGLKWVTSCKKCHHMTYYNYCINKACRNRLIKHGPYWTYHATQSMQPYNIKCPSCGEITVEMDNK